MLSLENTINQPDTNNIVSKQYSLSVQNSYTVINGGSFRQRKTKLHKLPFSTAHFHFITAQCTLKQAMLLSAHNEHTCLSTRHTDQHCQPS